MSNEAIKLTEKAGTTISKDKLIGDPQISQQTIHVFPITER
jgi:hypothetical protein